MRELRLSKFEEMKRAVPYDFQVALENVGCDEKIIGRLPDDLFMLYRIIEWEKGVGADKKEITIIKEVFDKLVMLEFGIDSNNCPYVAIRRGKFVVFVPPKTPCELAFVGNVFGAEGFLKNMAAHNALPRGQKRRSP